MPDDAVDTARDQRMPGLDGDQAAEPAAENKHRPHRSVPPIANRITPNQRTVSPSRIQISLRSAQAGTTASSRPITPKAPITQRLLRSSRTPELRFPPAKSAIPDITQNATANAMSAGTEKNAATPPRPRMARAR